MNPYVHDLTLQTVAFDDTPAARDAAGQPVRTVSSSSVRGLVQPRRVEEVPDPRSAGAEISDHVVFLPLATPIEHVDAILWGSSRLQVVGVRRFDFGRLAHLEVEARLVTATAVTRDEGGS